MVNAKPGLYPQGAVEIDSSADPFTIPSKPSRNLCLRSPRSKLDFNTHSPLAIYPPEGYHKSENGRLGFGQSVINTLLSSEVGSKSSRASSSRHYDYSLPDVLAFNYEMRFPIMSPSSISLTSSSSSSDSPPPSEPLPFAHFPYAQIWSDLADEISSSLSPFISIHWRTETLTPSNLLPCSQSLLQKILSLKQLHPEIKNVYLATDYPIEQLDSSLGGGGGVEEEEGVVAHSGTFAKVVTESHHKAMRKFLKDFDKLSKGGLRLTTFAKEQSIISNLDPTTSRLPSALISKLANLTLSSLPPNLDDSDSTPPRLNLGTLDSGLLGILDKLIVTKSQLFLTGVPGVGSSTVGACAKLSSFTNQLISAREGLMELQQEGREEEEYSERERGDGELWNTVMHWSLTGEDVD